MSKRPRRPHEVHLGDEIQGDTRDTTPDEDSDPVRRPLRRRVSRRSSSTMGPRKLPISSPSIRGTGISDEEALAPARLARVRVREAIVRIQGTKDEPRNDPGSERPEVRIDFVRSYDPSQWIERVGEDGFRIVGEAAGGGKVSIGIDGLIFGVTVEEGDSPERTVERLLKRVEAKYIGDCPDPASAILRER